MQSTTTNKLTLTKMQKEDLPFVNSTRNLDSTKLWLENNKTIDLESTCKWFENSNPNWYIIKVGSEKVGYVRTSDDTGKSLCIGCDIHPLHRRKGYAESCYKTLINDLFEKGYVNIWLDVFDKNIPAINLYTKLGFIPINSRLVRGENYTTMVYNNYGKK